MAKLKKMIKSRHMMELCKYGLVGGSAWIVQSIVYLVLVRLSIFPSIGMVIGTILGFIVSYFGHTKFTFQKDHKFSRNEFIKSIITSFIGLACNIGGVRLITKVLMLNPDYAILPTIFTPLITFLISKYWAFK